MKTVAIVGSGIAGISSAYYLHKLGYKVSLFESGSYFGGHTNTVDVELEGKRIPVDTGFLVHNDRTYPNLISFFEELSIDTHESDMSFSVDRRSDKLIWAGTSIFTVFAQMKNLFSIRFYRFLGEVLRFNRNSKKYMAQATSNLDLTLGELLLKEGFSDDFKNWYLLPMGGCIWSTPVNQMLMFPAHTFLVFSMNHGLLQIFNRPQWRTVLNGGRTYVNQALEGIDKKFLNEAVNSISWSDNKILLKTDFREEEFDYCIMATHPPETLRILSELELDSKEFLKEFKYQSNEAVLHSDKSVLPSKKVAWAAWNYLSVAKAQDKEEAVSVSYLINKLQPLPTNSPVIVTLNPVNDICKNKIMKKINYKHPIFSTKAIYAQGKIESLQGVKGIYFAGAWLRYGFHEDGILSAKRAIKSLLNDNGDLLDKVEIL